MKKTVSQACITTKIEYEPPKFFSVQERDGKCVGGSWILIRAYETQPKHKFLTKNNADGRNQRGRWEGERSGFHIMCTSKLPETMKYVHFVELIFGLYGCN